MFMETAGNPRSFHRIRRHELAAKCIPLLDCTRGDRDCPPILPPIDSYAGLRQSLAAWMARSEPNEPRLALEQNYVKGRWLLTGR